MSEQVLITGTTGQIGRHVVRRLMSDGHEVLALSRREVTPVSLRTEPDERGSDRPVASPANAVLIHLAGVSGRKGCSPGFCAEAAAFARRAIACAHATNASSAILASSIYATLEERGAKSPYGAHKLEIERIFKTEFRGRLVILRLPPVYGGDQDRSSIAAIGRLVDMGIPLPLRLAVADRDYLAMENLLQLISTLVARGSARTGDDVATYEPSDGSPTSTMQLIRHVGAMKGKDPLLLPIPEQLMRLLGAVAGKRELVEAAFSPLRSEGNSRLCDEAGWSPSVAMPESLAYLKTL